jgi:hypothetical protein
MFEEAEVTTIYDIWTNWFLVVWSIIDAMFGWIEMQTSSVFDAVPLASIQFVLAILCYGTLALLSYLTAKFPRGNPWRIAFSMMTKIFLVFTILFAVWRFGFVVELEERISTYTVSVFATNLIYALVAIFIAYVFYRDAKESADDDDERSDLDKIQILLKIVIWTCYLLTLLLAALFEGFLFTLDTWVQTALLITYFSTPYALLWWKDYKEREEG